MRERAKTSNGLSRWEWFVYAPIVLSALAAFGVLCAQTFIWLKGGRWVWIKLQDVGIQFPLARLKIDILGVNKVLAWLSNDVPILVWLVLIIPLVWRLLTAITESVSPNR